MNDQFYVDLAKDTSDMGYGVVLFVFFVIFVVIGCLAIFRKENKRAGRDWNETKPYYKRLYANDPLGWQLFYRSRDKH